MANPILVTGAAGRVGAVGRTVTELLLKRGKAVRAMVRSEDARAQALRNLGAEVVVGNLLDLDSMRRVITGCETMYFGMSVSDAYLTATVNVAVVAKHNGVGPPTQPASSLHCRNARVPSMLLLRILRLSPFSHSVNRDTVTSSIKALLFLSGHSSGIFNTSDFLKLTLAEDTASE